MLTFEWRIKTAEEYNRNTRNRDSEPVFIRDIYLILLKHVRVSQDRVVNPNKNSTLTHVIIHSPQY